MLNYRTAQTADLPAMMKMVEEAKEGFRARNIDQWQKGEPNEQGLTEGIEKREVPHCQPVTGLAASLFSYSEAFAKEKGVRNIRIDTHPDNLSMQKALAKNGYTFCGKITLCSGSEAGDPRFAYQKILN